MIKRCSDLVGACLLLALSLPLWLPAVAALRVRHGSPVLFRQLRAGLNGSPFVIYKLRTMLDLVDESGHPLPDADRLTSVGAFLRRTSIDELPELWNVLRGEMSLVGPRPLLPEYLGHYTSRQMRRHEVRPGITGWTQVTGRNGLSWEEKFERDVWYVENWSLLLDLRILLKTVPVVLSGSDVSAPDHVTAPAFDGNSSVGSD